MTAIGNAWISQQIFRHFSDSIEDLIKDIRSGQRSLDIVRLRLVTFDKMFFLLGEKRYKRANIVLQSRRRMKGEESDIFLSISFVVCRYIRIA